MRPILFRWRGRNVHSYHVLLYLGMVSAVVAGNHVARRSGLNPDGVSLATLLLTIPALVGARLLFVSTHWESYRHEWGRIWRRSDGGLSVYGGLLAVPISVPIISGVDVPFAAFWDVAVFSILIGMILGRFGCLLNGCCAGRPSERPGALRLPDVDGVWQRRIPTQILEIGWLLLLLWGAIVFWKRMPFTGGLFLCALTAYSVGRLALNTMRERRSGSGTLPANQMISALTILISLALLLIAQL